MGCESVNRNPQVGPQVKHADRTQDDASQRRHGENHQRESGSPGGREGPVVALHRAEGNQAVQRAARNGDGGGASRLSSAKVREAIQYNTNRFQPWGIRLIQDIVGSEPTGKMDASTVHMIAEWQADHGLTVDGKVGRYTLEPICERLKQEGRYNRVIHLIIDGHDMSVAKLPKGRDSVYYDKSYTNDIAITDTHNLTGDPLRVRIGPKAFNSSYEELVHTIRHEVEHVQQPSGMSHAESEFRAEATEILSQGMQLESLGGMMDDAARALKSWQQMKGREQKKEKNADLMQRVYDEIERRLNAAPADTVKYQVVRSGITYRKIFRIYKAYVRALP